MRSGNPRPVEKTVHTSRSHLLCSNALYSQVQCAQEILGRLKRLFTPPGHTCCVQTRCIHRCNALRRSSAGWKDCSHLPCTPVVFTRVSFTETKKQSPIRLASSWRVRCRPAVARRTLARPGARRTWTQPPTLTSARPPTRAWVVVRTVVARPLSVVDCVCGGGGRSCDCLFVGLFLSCCCVCDLFHFGWPQDPWPDQRTVHTSHSHPLNSHAAYSHSLASHPLYSQVQCDQEILGRMYAVLRKRRGEVCYKYCFNLIRNDNGCI